MFSTLFNFAQPSSTSSSGPFAGIPPVETAYFETSPEKRDRTLKHLLRANHQNHAVLYNRDRFHNHLPHILGSAYLLGASSEHLNAIYEDEMKELEPWRDSPGEISKEDWRSYWGDRRYQRAFLDFFEDELVRSGYNWKQVVMEYMLQGPEPLLHGCIGGLGHPLIHLGYAFELDNRELAMEALALASTNYNFLHKYIDQDFSTSSSPSTQSTDPLEILQRIRSDKRFDGLFSGRGADNIAPLFEKQESAVLEHYHSLDISDPASAHRLLTHTATLLLCASHEPGNPLYDFFIVHLLTVSYAVRTLLPVLPAEQAIPLVKCHWLFIIIVYCIELRPKVSESLIEEVDVKGKSWEDVVKKTLSQRLGGGERMEDPHYVKAVRALKDSARLWKDEDEWYLKAAVKFAWEFKHWGESENNEQLEVN